MASGSQNMTTYNARTVTGSNSAASPAGALLLSGADRANDATGDTWIFLDSYEGTSAPWGIKHDQANNKIHIYGSNTDSVWTRMDTGDTYILGKVGIGYDPETSENSYKLYVNGNSYFNGDTTHNGIDYFANGTTYYINNSADGYLNALQLKTNLTFDATDITGTSGKITWSGSTDAADIYYYVPTSDQGNLIINTRDDTNCLVAFAYNGTIKAYINNSTPSFYPATTNTGTIGTSTYEWGTTYTSAIYARHFDASYPYTSDRNMYYGYNKADNHYFYTMDGTTRTHRATINATGLFINQPATNRNAGIIGSYDYTKAALIWSMGASYNIAANGSGLGSLYGAAYGYGGQAYLGSKPLAGGHQFIWCENGVPQVALGNTGVWIKKNGAIKWDPYVESATDASDVTQIVQIASGVAGGTELRIQQANDATDVINLMSHSHIYMNSKKAFTINDAWLRINEDKAFSSGVYFGTSTVRTDGDLWSDSVRLVDNWVGFYNAVQGGTRYGYIQANANRMYFRKENGVSTYHFDFNGHLYASSNLYAGGSVLANNGLIYSTYNGIQAVFGAQNTGWVHFTNNGGKNWYFDHPIHAVTGFTVYNTGTSLTNNNLTFASGGGWYMIDTTWVRTCNNKAVYTGSGTLRSDESTWGQKVRMTSNWLGFYSGNGGGTRYGYIQCDASRMYFRKENGVSTYHFDMNGGYLLTSRCYNAVWNDYAECRAVATEEPGRCVMESSSGEMQMTTKRLEPGCKIISDTYGTCIGATDTIKIPIAVSGRVLVYPYQDRNNYPLGAAVCSGPNGTVDLMTRNEIMMYPERIIGTVSEIPTYEIWHCGSKELPEEVKVNGRIWIYVR